jgi:peptidyl-prolyl cis-trans isomerase D
MIRFLQSEHPARKVIFVFIIGISCVAMVLFLIPGFMTDTGQTASGVLVKVGDESIATQEVQNEAQNVQQQRHYPEMLMPLLYQQISQELVQRSALTYEAHRMGLRVSDQEIVDELRDGPYKNQFFPNGQWIGAEKYKELLSENNLTVDQFERNLRTQLLLRKLEALITSGVSVNDDEAYQMYKEQNQKVKFQYALLTAQDLAKSVNPSEAELKKYFEDNKQSFASAIPEKRDIQYVVIDKSKVEGGIKVSDDDLRRYYADHKDEFKVPDEVKVRHILIKTARDANGNVTPEADAAAKAKAESVLKQVQAGGDFAQLAGKYSDDEGSKTQGGSIGWIQRGRTVPEFEKTAFSLEKGQTSGLVKTEFGYHIIRVEDKHTAHTPTFEEVKPQIEPAVRAMKAAQALDTVDRTIESQARTSGGFAAAAQKNGLQVFDSGLVTKTDSLPGVGNSPAFMQEAFAAEANNPPESVATPQGYVVFVVTKIEQPKPPTFEEVRAQVVGQFKAMQGQRLLQSKLQELADKAHSEHDLAKAAKAMGATVKTSELVTPQQQVPDIGAMQNAAEVFDLAPGQISGPIMLQGSGIVANVLEKQEPPRNEFEAKKDQVRDQVIQRKRNQVLQLYLANLMKQLDKDGKIKWNEQERNSLMKSRSGI